MNFKKKECPHCFKGSGKRLGHSGRHKLWTPEESKKLSVSIDLLIILIITPIIIFLSNQHFIIQIYDHSIQVDQDVGKKKDL